MKRSDLGLFGMDRATNDGGGAGNIISLASLRLGAEPCVLALNLPSNATKAERVGSAQRRKEPLRRQEPTKLHLTLCRP
jgi:hypothetical protein